MRFEFFHTQQAEQYAFYRIPKIFFTDNRFRRMSVEAKILYGLMLDRVSLSLKNRWIDKEGRVYIIYTIQEIMESLGCAEQKAVKILSELEKSCGLIQKKRRGMGRPNLIYVKNFSQPIYEEESFDEPLEENGENDHKEEKDGTESENMEKEEVIHNASENHNSAKCMNCDFQIHELRNGKFYELLKSQTIKTEKNNKELNKNPILSLSTVRNNPSLSAEDKDEDGWTDDGNISPDVFPVYSEDAVKKQLHYDYLIQDYPERKPVIDNIMALTADLVNCVKDGQKVGGEKKTAAEIRSRFRSLSMEDIVYVTESLQENFSRIFNIRQYLITALYRAPETIAAYYQSKVLHDMQRGLI